MKKILAFYTFNENTSSYVRMMQSFLEEKYEIVNYKDVKQGIIDISQVNVFYLNWLENKFDEMDKKILKKAKLLGKKIVWVFHNRIPHDVTEEKLVTVHNTYKYIIKISDTIIIHSKNSVKYLQEYCSKLNVNKVHYIPHIEFIGDYFSFGNIREQLGIPKDTIVYAMYGQIKPYKNIEVAIEAFNKLSLKNNAKLLIVGKASNVHYVEQLKTKISSDNILIINKWINDLEMKSYLDAADVLLLPYNKKSSMNSGVMLMAFSYKKTVIVPRICMADDFDEELIYKYDYELNDEEHVKILSQIMQKAYEEGKEILKTKGATLFEVVEELCSKDVVKQKLLELV